MTNDINNGALSAVRYVSKSSLAALAVSLAVPALAQEASIASSSQSDAVKNTEQDNSNVGVREIIVTAQKRAQSLNDVGMSVQASTGEDLTKLGIADASDLGKIVPGFVFTQTASGTPVYTLRGIGFYETGLVAPPAVSVYVDEVPLAYPLFSSGAAFDLERVEVLKGPQGTLFGQNATGGAINYIAAKPTSDFDTGATISWSRFNVIEAEGFVSGPITNDLRARLAVKGESGGDWQYSASRPDDTNGGRAMIQGRFLLDWDASDSVRFGLNLNGFSNQSDSQVPQFVANVALPKPFAPSKLFDVLNSAVPPGNNARVAEWPAGSPQGLDEKFYQAALRADIDLTDTITLTSLTSYQDLKVNNFVSTGATVNKGADLNSGGFVESFNQELRLAGKTDSLNWLFGASYEWVDSSTILGLKIPELTASYVIPGLPSLTAVRANVDQQLDTYAVFGNVDYQLTDSLSIQAGARYTKANRSALSCSRDAGNNETGVIFTILQGIFSGDPASVVPIGPGQCYSLGLSVDNFVPDLDGTPGELNEDNLSWRLGLNYKTDGDALLYANYSRGYKAGTFVATVPSSVASWFPAVQERLDAFEVGFKTPLADRRVNLSGAAFYYDYKNKQTRGRVFDPTFNLLERSINVPKSRVWGVEGALQTELVEGLRINASALYLNTKISGAFETYAQDGTFGDFQGSELPYSPKFTATLDTEYEAPISDSVNGFLGALFTYRSKAETTFSLPGTKSSFVIDGYGLLDMRAGIADPDGTWRVTAFARNVTNKFYINTFLQGTDTQYRFAGMPRTYGLQLTLRPKL